MNILVVDDDRDCREATSGFLRELGHQVTECGDGQTALKVFQQGDFPMVLSDIKMPGMSGLALLKAIVELPQGKYTDVVLFTGFGDLETVISALRFGVYDYLLKPIHVEELAAITERICEHQVLRRENEVLSEHFDAEVQAATAETHEELARLKQTVAQSVGLGEVGFFSKTMCNIVEQAKKYYYDRNIPVLIEGETGTGKEIIARIIHYGEMKDSLAPFVDVNCAALTPSLFESELFGYEGGAYTGSLSKGHKGQLDMAMAGTLFLDEVGEIPLQLQGKLLRVLQEKEFYRVGGLKKLKTNIRIICATNIDLVNKIAMGGFRRDLFYRLNIGHIVIPPLRQHPEDILPLALLFLRQFSKQKQKRFYQVSAQAKTVLLGYSWPGNVLELRNAMEWAVFMFDDVELRPEHLSMIERQQKTADTVECIPSPVQFTVCQSSVTVELPQPTGKVVLPLDNYVQAIIRQALQLNQNNKTATARYLGVTRRSLYSRLQAESDNP